jgi:hypothetical protein
MPDVEKVELSADELEFFNELDVDSAAEDPFKHPLGTFEFECISALKVRGKLKEDGSQSLGIVFTWGSDDGQVTRWMNLPKPGITDAKRQKQLSYIRADLNAYGVPSDEHSQVLRQLINYDNDSSVKGLKITATVVDDGDYQVLQKIQPAGTGAVGNASAGRTVSSSVDDDFE